MTPPTKTLAVGGSSNLQLLLRADYFSVQNLSRAGENWSFTRPLDGGSTLPLCAHLGDVTLRVRAAGAADGTAYDTYSIALAASAA